MAVVKKTQIKIQNKTAIADLQYFHPDGLKELQSIFKTWISLNKKISKLKTKAGGRRVNIHEALTEGAFAYFRKSPRLSTLRWKNKKSGQSEPSSSFDCYDIKNKKRIQVKATSSKSSAPSSFGPQSEQDKVYFLDFYNKGKIDGKFDIYEIPIAKIYKVVVHKQKGETVAYQASLGKRPRFSLRDKIIKPNNLKPKWSYDLMTGKPIKRKR